MITEQDISPLVPEFYARVRKDPLLGPIFDGAIEDWPHHLVKLQEFWSSVMLTSGRYKGQPMVAHVRHEADMTEEAFGRWLAFVLLRHLGGRGLPCGGRRRARFSRPRRRPRSRRRPGGSPKASSSA